MTSLDKKVRDSHVCPGGITCRMCRESRKDRVKIVRQGKRKMKALVRREISRDEA